LADLLGLRDGERASTPRLLDLGCGWGALGVALAGRLDRLQVEGLDLDPELLSAGRRVVASLGLRRRVRLAEGDLTAVDEIPLGRYDAVACQALLVHLPGAADVLASLARSLPPGIPFAAVEGDAAVRAASIRDSVTDVDPSYAEQREEVVAAVVVGARRTLRVERSIGSALDTVLRGAGFLRTGATPVASDQRLAPPYTPGERRPRWFAERLRRRREAGGDPVDRFLATAGGLPEPCFDDWVARQQDADVRRLQSLRGGEYSRDEGGGVFVGWGVSPAG